MPLSRRATRWPSAAAAILAGALLLVGCSGAPSASEESPTPKSAHVFAEAEADAFPVTIEHGLGKTEIAEQPDRVVVIGWAGSDLAVALGTVPVAQGVAAGIEEEYYPWFKEAVTELGAELPVVDPSLERGEVDIEFVLAQNPDLILAIGSGITEVEYQRLSEIAPTVAYADGPWATSIPEHLELMGKALGRSAAATEVQQKLDDLLKKTATEHPELDGVSYMHGFVPGDDGSTVVFSSIDARAQTLEALGLEPLPEVTKLMEESGRASSFTIGLEELRALNPEVYVLISDDKTWQSTLDSQPVFASWGPVAKGNTAIIADMEVGMAFSTSTPLGLTWALGDIADVLSEAVQ